MSGSRPSTTNLRGRREAFLHRHDAPYLDIGTQPFPLIPQIFDLSVCGPQFALQNLNTV